MKKELNTTKRIIGGNRNDNIHKLSKHGTRKGVKMKNDRYKRYKWRDEKCVNCMHYQEPQANEYLPRCTNHGLRAPLHRNIKQCGYYYPKPKNKDGDTI